MKKLLYILPATLLLMASCEDIGEDNRYIEVEPIKAERRVLLEEFTGQLCTNCPDAHAIIEKLEEQYGPDLIVVSIHAGQGNAIAAPAGLMQPVGNEYAARWGVSSYPCGVVDRTGGVLSRDAWAAAIRTDMAKETTADIQVSATQIGDSIAVTSLISSSLPLDASLQLWVTEDSIVAFQIDNGKRVPDYVHNNVFRACVNGTWGQPIDVAPNVYYTATDTIAIEEDWNPDHLHIVGFIFDDSGVIQADKTKLTPNP